MRVEDTEPWYKQFWPWFLIALPGSVVIAGLSTVYIANRYSDDLVVDEYYKDGLAINAELKMQRLAKERGISASIQVLDRRMQLRLAGEGSSQTLTLRLSHPLEADQDFTVQLTMVAPGLFDAALPSPVKPNWHWTLTPATNRAGISAFSDGQAGSPGQSLSSDSTWRLDGSLTAANFIDNDVRD